MPPPAFPTQGKHPKPRTTFDRANRPVLRAAGRGVSVQGRFRFMSPILRMLIPVLVIAAATPALAQTAPDAAPPAKLPRAFVAADTDHDGRLSFAEFKAMVQRFEARRAARHPEAAAQMAKLTPEQLDTRLHKRFDRIDTDHDGFIEPAEWLQMRGRIRAAKAARQDLPAPTKPAPPASNP